MNFLYILYLVDITVLSIVELQKMSTYNVQSNKVSILKASFNNLLIVHFSIDRQILKSLTAGGIKSNEWSASIQPNMNRVFDVQQSTMAVNFDVGHLVHWYTNQWDHILPQSMANVHVERAKQYIDAEISEYENKLAVLEE